jgi:two-component system, cell cycle response regulator
MNPPPRILVTDDQADICEVVRAFLESWGCAVDAVTSGRQALDLIASNDYDVAIVDLDLGDMSGLKVLEAVRARSQTAEVVILSGFGTQEHVSEAIGLGASAYIQKPVTFAEVDARVREALAKRRFAAGVEEAIRGVGAEDRGMPGRLRQAYLLYDLGKRLITTLDYQRVIDTVLDSLLAMVACECASILLVEPGGAVLHVASDLPLSPVALDAVRDEVLAFWRSLRKEEIGESQAKVHFRARGPSRARTELDPAGRTLKVPLSVQDRVVGVLVLRMPAAAGQADSHAESLPYIAGSLAAHALDNASLHRHTRMLALTDGLTGLLNHRAFLDRLNQEFDRSRRYRSLLALILFDIDDFKSVNDTHGHLQGDVALEGIARILRKTSRESDILGRYGGEEFVALLPETNPEQAVMKAERIRNEIQNHSFRLNGTTVHITVSLGVATWPSSRIQKPEDLIRDADEALYRSKSLGKNRSTLAG